MAYDQSLADAHRRIAELEDELEKADDRCHRFNDKAMQYKRERDEARRYGACLPGCNWHESNNPRDCDCGWYRLKAEWDGEVARMLDQGPPA